MLRKVQTIFSVLDCKRQPHFQQPVLFAFLDNIKRAIDYNKHERSISAFMAKTCQLILNMTVQITTIRLPGVT
jgi:hypothetical protein